MQIELNNFEKVTEIAEKYPSVAEKHINKAIAKIFSRVLIGVNKNAPVGVTGHLKDNWTSNIQRFAGTLRSNQSYGGSVEYGTAPHKVSAEALKDWASKKGLNPYAVAKSIAKKGTKANPFLKKTIEEAKNNFEDDLKECINNITKDLA